MDAESVIRHNIQVLASPQARDIALSESVGGNAGSACYALNLEVDPDGRIVYVGNHADRVNATMRVFVPSFSLRETKLTEMAIELGGTISETAKRAVTVAGWIWNLRRIRADRPLVQQFMDGAISWGTLLELLRAKYPELVKELE